MVILWLLIYTLGILLAFGRINAMFYGGKKYFESRDYYPVIFILSMFSWLGFIAGTVMYFQFKEKQFFNFN